MTTQELEAAILENVQAIYNRKYVGKLKVQHLANHPETPLVIAAELSDQEFLKFVEKELHARHLEMTDYFTGYKIEDPYNNCNNTTSCYDK